MKKAISKFVPYWRKARSRLAARERPLSGAERRRRSWLRQRRYYGKCFEESSSKTESSKLIWLGIKIEFQETHLALYFIASQKTWSFCSSGEGRRKIRISSQNFISWAGSFWASRTWNGKIKTAERSEAKSVKRSFAAKNHFLKNILTRSFASLSYF